MSLNLDKSSWKRVLFGDVVNNLNVTIKDPEADGIDRVIAMEHLDPGELRVNRWGDLSDGTTFTRRVRPGQTLFGKRRAYQRKAAYAEFEAICSGDILVFQVDAREMLPEFLPFLVQSDGFYGHALGTSAGSLSPRTNWRDLASYEFDLPPLEEQKRIAELFWAVEAERESHVNVIQALETSEAAWVGSLTRKTDSKALLGDVVDTILDRRGITPKKLGGDFVESGVPVLSAMNIVGGDIDFARQRRYVSDAVAERWMTGPLLPGDILMTSEAPLGSTVLIGREMRACLGQRLFAIRPNSSVLMPEFLYSWINSAAGQSALEARASGTTVRGIRQAELVKIEVPIPDFDTQKDFLRGWQVIQEAKQAEELAIRNSRKLFGGLLRETFGGRT